jgi:hypothetical protein
VSEPEKLRNEIETIKTEVTAVAAENMALQLVLACFFHRLGETIDAARVPILQAFDDAANHAEKFSIIGGKQSGHLPETLRIIEQMRLMLVGEDKPKREV